MRNYLDPALLTPDDRRRQIATILAAGLLRLHARAMISARSTGVSDSPQVVPKSGHTDLEVSSKMRLNVHTG